MNDIDKVGYREAGLATLQVLSADAVANDLHVINAKLKRFLWIMRTVTIAKKKEFPHYNTKQTTPHNTIVWGKSVFGGLL